MINGDVFFAAANGYDGFISYFDKVFNPRDFARIYILKGGPGTGKSSLMRKISQTLSSRGASCESILCSSDKNSLDGIICTNGEASIAMIDGTAPHERDTQLPGAKDELINLGECWDKRWLCAKQNEISELNFEKKNAYRTAYSYLKIAGAAAREASGFLYCDDAEKRSKSAAKSLAESINGDTGKKHTRLYSSFGKSGFYHLNSLESIAKKHYTLLGDSSCAASFLRCIADVLDARNCGMIISPSPLEKSNIEGLFIEGDDVLISTFEGGEVIDLAEIIKSDTLTHERLKAMHGIEESALEASKRWFGIASDFHFRLEEIYKASMDFDKNEEIATNKIAEITEILKLS